MDIWSQVYCDMSFSSKIKFEAYCARWMFLPIAYRQIYRYAYRYGQRYFTLLLPIFSKSYMLISDELTKSHLSKKLHNIRAKIILYICICIHINECATSNVLSTLALKWNPLKKTQNFIMIKFNTWRIN